MTFLRSLCPKYIIVFIFCLLQLFFIKHYRTDKTILASQITESIAMGKSIYGTNIPCSGWGDIAAGSYTKWAEEPPVYHAIGAVFYVIGLGDFAYRLYPLICFLLLTHALWLLLKEFRLLSRLSQTWFMAFLLFMPYVFIHGHRPLPDNLSVALLVYFLFFFYKENKRVAFFFALAAVTTKALAIFAIFPLCLGELICSKDKKKTFFENIGFAATLIPTLLWFYHLSQNGIDNPFFETGSLQVQQSGGINFVDLTTRKYWSRLLSWSAVRGVGIVIFSISVWTVFKLKNTSRVFQLTMYGILGHLLYVILVRGPQRAAPWYSFYFLPYYTIMFFIWASKVKKSLWVKTIIALNIIMSLSFVRYSADIFNNVRTSSINEAGIPCHFHRYIYEKHKREGRL